MFDKEKALEVFGALEMPSLYSVLLGKARSFGYTRRDIRNDVRRNVKMLRTALANGGYGVISMSGGQYTLYESDNLYTTGYDPRLVIAGYIAGLPVIDWRRASRHEHIVSNFYNLPICVIGDTKRKRAQVSTSHRPFSYVLVPKYMELAMGIGATLHYAPTKLSKEYF